MISVLVEPRSARRSSGAGIALGSLIAYAGIASIAAGAGSAGAGLAVFAMGLLAATVVDFVLWREIAFREPEAVDAKPAAIPALPPPQAVPLTIEPAPEKASARSRKVRVSVAPDDPPPHQDKAG